MGESPRESWAEKTGITICGDQLTQAPDHGAERNRLRMGLGSPQ